MVRLPFTNFFLCVGIRMDFLGRRIEVSGKVIGRQLLWMMVIHQRRSVDGACRKLQRLSLPSH